MLDARCSMQFSYAIAYQNALRVRTESDLPYEWAETQNNLGVAYSDRIAGTRRENLETAIYCFTETLKVRTESDFPYEWAETQNNLGNAYRDRVVGNREDITDLAENILDKLSEIWGEDD